MAIVLVACDSVVFGNDGGVGVNYSRYANYGGSVFGGGCVGGEYCTVIGGRCIDGDGCVGYVNGYSDCCVCGGGSHLRVDRDTSTGV